MPHYHVSAYLSIKNFSALRNAWGILYIGQTERGGSFSATPFYLPMSQNVPAILPPASAQRGNIAQPPAPPATPTHQHSWLYRLVAYTQVRWSVRSWYISPAYPRKNTTANIYTTGVGRTGATHIIVMRPCQTS